MFLSKQILLCAVKQLSFLDGGKKKQGLTQKVSAIRYFLAADSLFKKLNQSALNTAITESKKQFEQHVAYVVGVSSSWYTPDFRTLKDDDGGCCTGSNFFSAGAVEKSKKSEEKFEYPTRFPPLLQVYKGVVSLWANGYENIVEYFPSDKFKVALLIWLARSCKDLDAEHLWEQVVLNFKSVYSDTLVRALLPSEAAYNDFIEQSKVTDLLQIEPVEFDTSDFDSVDSETSEQNVKSSQPKADNLGLTVGMRSNEKELPRLQGFVTILDDDNYCYQVLCNSDEVDANIRTISKALVKEFVEALQEHPTYNAEALDNLLTGKSEIDKFEYGNNAVVYKLALMALGRLGYTLVDVSKYQNRRMGRSPQPERIPLQDRLTIALKYFEEHRYNAEWQKKVDTDDYLDVYTMPEIDANTLAEMSLEEFKAGFLSKVWAFRNGGARKYNQLQNDGERQAYKAFVVKLKQQLESFDAYFPPSVKCPNGMGVGVVTELLMRFWPKSCCSYNEGLIHDALVVLGLSEGAFAWPKTPTIYQDFMGKCAKILCKMEEMKLPRRPSRDNDETPDYFTVNEFLWFVHDNKDLIESEVLKMSKKVEKVKKAPKTGSRTIKDAVKDDALMQRLMAALRTKPFAILAGHSGTGKSRLVRCLAYMTCNDEGLLAEAAKQNAPGNYLMVQVKPNWHDSSDLLGYYSEVKGEYKTTAFVDFICKAYAYPDTPFFVCLDEMNLAPVEHYFAEYLSAIESVKEKDGVYSCDRLIANKDVKFYQLLEGNEGYKESQEAYEKHGLIIPKNLFVVGTVNVDESTHQFSRKVLDRAMTLLMNEVKFETMTQNVKDPSEEELLTDEGIEFFLNREFKTPLLENEPERLNKLNDALKGSPFVVAYRFANEMALYREAIKKLDDDADALDHVVLMKLLPRIHGTKGDVGRYFAALKPLFGEKALSVAEMKEIEARQDEYLSFWP